MSTVWHAALGWVCLSVLFAVWWAVANASNRREDRLNAADDGELF